MVKMLSKFLVRDRYALAPGVQDSVTLSLDAQAATLRVFRDGLPIATYAFVDEKGHEISWAIQIEQKAQAEELQIGEARFEREALLIEHFPISHSELTFRIADDGHIGILDISDIGGAVHQDLLGILVAKDRERYRKVVYFFDLMPIVIAFERKGWVIRTLKYDDLDPIGPWYFIN